MKSSRPPIELRQIDAASCLVNVVGQLQYVWRRSDKPDLRQISRATRRKPGQPLTLPYAQFFLLREGFSLVEVTDWDSEAFVREGDTYARRYFGRQYRAATKGVNVAQLRNLEAAVLRRKAPYLRTGQLTVRVEDPSAEAIQRLLVHGWSVVVEIRRPRNSIPHVGLFLPHEDYANGSTIRVYSPDVSHTTLRQVTFENAMSEIALEHVGFMAVGLR